MRFLSSSYKFLFFLFWSVSFSGIAQQNRIKGGGLLGLSSSQINGDGFGGFDKVGFTAGFFLEHSLKDRWDLLVELTYLNKGSFDPPIAQIGKFNTKKISLSYVELPVLIKYSIQKVRVLGGLSLGALVRDKQYRDGLAAVGNDVILGPFNKLEVAQHLGIEYHFTDQWAISWRHSMSILPISNRLTFDPTFLKFIGGAFNHSMVITVRRTF